MLESAISVMFVFSAAQTYGTFCLLGCSDGRDTESRETGCVWWQD